MSVIYESAKEKYICFVHKGTMFQRIYLGSVYRVMRQPGYLDYNASAPLRPEAAEYMTSLMGPARNPSSIHSFGRSSKLIMETARSELAELAGGNASGFMFTSGGTEANNTALLGLSLIHI